MLLSFLFISIFPYVQSYVTCKGIVALDDVTFRKVFLLYYHWLYYCLLFSYLFYFIVYYLSSFSQTTKTRQLRTVREKIELLAGVCNKTSIPFIEPGI